MDQFVHGRMRFPDPVQGRKQVDEHRAVVIERQRDDAEPPLREADARIAHDGVNRAAKDRPACRQPEDQGRAGDEQRRSHHHQGEMLDDMHPENVVEARQPRLQCDHEDEHAAQERRRPPAWPPPAPYREAVDAKQVSGREERFDCQRRVRPAPVLPHLHQPSSVLVGIGIAAAGTGCARLSNLR